MSDPTTPVHNPSPISSYPPDPIVLDHPNLATADPLLQSGSYIDHAATNHNHQQQHQQEANGVEPKSETAPFRSRRKPLTTAIPPSADSANWLPPGWLVEDRVRSSGATAGSVDKYYIDPVSGRRFRSKKEVQYYLETGTLKRKKRESENAENFTESSGIQKTKEAGKKAKVYKRNFDYLNVPDRVEWALTDASKDSWSPSIGDEKVSEYDRQNWDFEILHLHP